MLADITITTEALNITMIIALSVILGFVLGVGLTITRK